MVSCTYSPSLNVYPQIKKIGAMRSTLRDIRSHIHSLPAMLLLFAPLAVTAGAATLPPAATNPSTTSNAVNWSMIPCPAFHPLVVLSEALPRILTTVGLRAGKMTAASPIHLANAPLKETWSVLQPPLAPTHCFSTKAPSCTKLRWVAVSRPCARCVHFGSPVFAAITAAPCRNVAVL
jgi:hypothetical protein